MAFWRRKRSSGGEPTSDRKAVRAHFAAFAESRLFVEAWVEPATNVTTTTVVLIAHDGEWTRRAVADRDEGFAIAGSLGIPVHDVLLTGYPDRMREWTRRQRSAE